MYYRLNLVRILNFLLFLVIVFSPFQNTLLRESNLRYLGASPSFLFVITIILLYIFKKIYQWTNFDFRVNVSSLITGVYLIIAFLLGFTVYFGEVSYERDLIGKGFSLIILNFLLLFPFYVSFNLNEKYCLIGIKLALGVMIIALITFDYLSPTYLDNSFFQSNVRPSFRPRGFSPEPSYFAVSFFCLLIGGFVLQRKKNFILFYVLTFSFGIVLLSKGAIFSLLLSLILVYIFTNKVSLIIKVSILIITLLSYFLITLLFFSQESVLEQVTFVTRITVIISSVFSLFTHPLGVTPFGFLSSFYDNINYVVSYLDSFDFILNTSEVKRYINADSDNEIGTKSFFFNFIYYFGWPFLALFFYKLIKAIRICREHKRQDLELAIWFVSISLFSFVEGVGLYPISILLFIIINELKKIQKID